MNGNENPAAEETASDPAAEAEPNAQPAADEGAIDKLAPLPTEEPAEAPEAEENLPVDNEPAEEIVPNAEPASAEDEITNKESAAPENAPATDENAAASQKPVTVPTNESVAVPADGSDGHAVEEHPEDQATGSAPTTEDYAPAPEEPAAVAVDEEAKPSENTENQPVAGEPENETAAPTETLPTDSAPDSTGEEEFDEQTVEFSRMTKTEIVDTFAELLESHPVQSLRPHADAAKIAFYKLHRQDIETWKKEFVESGRPEEEFVPPADGEEERLKTLLNRYREKRDEVVQETEKQKEENYKVKLAIIEELKDLINKNETMNDTFKTFRDLQARWKETGQVPQGHVKDLWETYHLHVENFYNFIKINRELRDLDLKKNAEEKIRLCEEAEALLLEPSIVSAFHKLQKLHELWRETGPVAHEYKEQLWERFKEASSKINKRHQEHFESLKEEQKHNLDLKTELCVKTEELGDREYTSRKEWEEASEQLIEIQKVWKTIGFAPKKDNNKIYERFRVACDRFFEKKREFYSVLKTQMEENLQAKTAICEKAEALQESTDWKRTTDELIALQKQWKEIGAVPRKNSEVIWKRFRKACDAFFENKSKHFSAIDNQYDENLEKKKALIEEIRAFTVTDREESFEALKEFQRRWAEIGYVPIRQKDKIQAEYRELIDAHFNTLRGNDKDRKIERFREKLTGLKDGKKSGSIRHERDRLYNKMKQLESDVQVLENNIGFFSNSKNAESLIRDVQEKIARAREEMQTIIDKIKLIDSQSEE